MVIFVAIVISVRVTQSSIIVVIVVGIFVVFVIDSLRQVVNDGIWQSLVARWGGCRHWGLIRGCLISPAIVIVVIVIITIINLT